MDDSSKILNQLEEISTEIGDISDNLDTINNNIINNLSLEILFLIIIIILFCINKNIKILINKLK